MASPGPEPTPPAALPAPEPSDSEEVARALKLAQTLWDEGQRREAVRTLQRGAAQAEEDGNDLRALALARSAADLSVGLPATVPPNAAEEPSIVVEIDVPSEPNSVEVPLVSPNAVAIPRASSVAPKPTNGVSGFVVPVTQREVRVSVKRSALDESLFVVRPLAPGAQVPAGTREAVLVFSDVDPE